MHIPNNVCSKLLHCDRVQLKFRNFALYVSIRSILGALAKNRC